MNTHVFTRIHTHTYLHEYTHTYSHKYTRIYMNIHVFILSHSLKENMETIHLSHTITWRTITVRFLSLCSVVLMAVGCKHGLGYQLVTCSIIQVIMLQTRFIFCQNKVVKCHGDLVNFQYVKDTLDKQ